MSVVCVACGGTAFATLPYKNASDERGIVRAAKDVAQSLGWTVLPLHHLPAGLSRSFAQGLFKFKTVRRCRSCGLGVLHPMPSTASLNRLYAHFFDLGYSSAKLPPLHPRGVSQANYLAKMLDLKPVVRSLEFGAGSACLTRRLKEIHPPLQTTVIELSRPMLPALRSDSAIGTVLTAYNGSPGEFDLIMSSHALEHVPDARATLAEWVSWLRPGGWLMIEVPHANDDHYDVPHEYVPHSYFFTKQALKLLVENCGMETVAIGGGGQTWTEARSGRPYPTEPDDWARSGDAGANLRGLWRRPLR